MLDKIREKLLSFIASNKDVPLLAGFSIGFYLILFIYARNLGMYNSLIQVVFFIAYYIIMPMAVLYIGYKLAVLLKLTTFKKNFLFIGMIGFLSFFLLEINYIVFSKKIIFGLIMLFAAILSLWFKKYYKLFILLLFLISIFNIPVIIQSLTISANVSNKWKQQPDDIEDIVFKIKPNIYYIQPDGYTSFKNLKDSIYNFDDSNYEKFLEVNNFTLYKDYRSNYASTLLSNSATFSMKHHFAGKGIEEYDARDIIIGDNPVLRILKNNGYKTHFITESPYLIINRPKLAYDTTNIMYAELPFSGEGSGVTRDVITDLKSQMALAGNMPDFYFIEKFTPSHIYNNKPQSRGIEGEKRDYLRRLKEANIWLKEIIREIIKKDPGGVIIIGADHGGFVGFEYMGQSFESQVNNELLVNSIFGAQLAVKWNNTENKDYDKGLKSGINLFRTLFSFLAKDRRYLYHQQDNSSYIHLDRPRGLYKYIDNNGNIVLEKTTIN